MEIRLQRQVVGQFGGVFKGDWNGRQVAVRRIPIGEISQADIHQEDALKTLDHRNVIRLLHAENDANFRYYATEWCLTSMDRLFDAEHDGPLPKDDHLAVRQLAEGLEYIHQMNLIHRQLKPENVLVCLDQSVSVCLKWADFGLLDRRRPATSDGRCWMAPELDATDDQIRGTIESDVFSEGLVFAFFLSKGKHPFGCRPTEIVSNIRLGKLVHLNAVESNHLRQLIADEMLPRRPEERITSSDVVRRLQLIQERRNEKLLLDWCRSTPNNDRDAVFGCLENLLDSGVNVNCTDERGSTPLLHLARRNDGNAFDAVRLLIDRGANVNCRGVDGENPLMKLITASSSSSTDLMDAFQHFVDAGIDLQFRNAYDEHVGFYLCRHYRRPNLKQMMETLISAGVDINANNEYGHSALPVLCRHYTADNLIDIVALFADQKADDDLTTDNEVTAVRLLFKHYKGDDVMDISYLLSSMESRGEHLPPMKKLPRRGL